jgi:hemoglobin
MDALIDHQTKFLATVMGGPGDYDDGKLKSAHRKLKITETEWNEVVGILIETLKNFEVDADDIILLANLINSKKPLIVMGS